MPIVCPPWCSTNHAAAPGGSNVVTPLEAVIAHETELAAGTHISVDYVQDQLHPESSREAREYVAIWTTGDGPIEVPPSGLAAASGDFGATLARALERLAEIGSAK